MTYNERQLNNGQQGTGSGLDADKTDGKEASEFGSSFDGDTIQDDENGDKAVKKPSTTIIGDFENDIGGWNGGTRTTNIAYNGTTAVEFKSDNPLTRDLDLTPIDSIIFYFNDNPDSGYATRFEIDGVEEFVGGGKTTFTKAEVDTSNMTGVKTLKFTTGSTSAKSTIDYIQAVYGKGNFVDASAGGSS